MDQRLESVSRPDHKDQEQTRKTGAINDYTPSNPLLHVFVQYAWNKEHGPFCDNLEYRIIEKWLECDSKGKQFTLSPIDNKKDEYSKYEKIINHLGDILKNILRWLVYSKGDINYAYCSGDTIFHLIFNDRLQIPDNPSEDEIIKIRKLMRALIEMKAPLFKKNQNNEMPISMAIKSKNKYILPAIVDSLIDVEECDEDGNTVLHIIVDNCVNEKEDDHKKDYLDLIRTLILKGVSVNVKNNNGVTPVHLAAEKFHFEMLKLFAENGANFNERTSLNETPLHSVCKSLTKLKVCSKVIKTFDYLISKGCSIWHVALDNYTPLHCAAESGRTEIVKKFIDWNFDVDCRTERTLLTPLYLAAKGNQLENMKLLVKAGADVNAEAVDCSTPIFMSAMLGSYESLQFLIDEGADLYRRDNLRGFTLLHMVANNLSFATEEKRKNNKLKIFKALIEKNLNVNDTGYCGISPLQLVILARSVEATKILIDRGADVNYQNEKLEWFPQHLAVIMKDLETTKILIENGADVNCRGCDQRIPLHLALLNKLDLYLGIFPKSVERDHASLLCPISKCLSYNESKFHPYKVPIDLMNILIENGANVNVQDTHGETPLLIAANFYRKSALVMEKLLDMGAWVDVQDKDGHIPLHHSFARGDGEAMQVLMKYCADLNDVDTRNLIMSFKDEINLKRLFMYRSKATCKVLVIKEVIKRKIIGLPVATIYEQLINDPKFGDIYNKCLAEAQQLMNHRDTDGFSYYEFLKMNPKRQYGFVQKVLDKNEKVKEQFPIYANLIRGACRYSSQRKTLLESAKRTLNEIIDFYLPDLCIEQILDYLNNRYLNVFISIAEETPVVEKNKIEFQLDCSLVQVIVEDNMIKKRKTLEIWFENIH